MDPDIFFQGLSSSLNIPLDKVRYGLLYFSSFPLALILRLLLHYRYTSATVRHAYCTFFGILYCWLCFKWQVFYLLAFVSVGYILLLALPHHRVHIFTLLYTIAGVSAGHIYRMVIDYGTYTLDFSVPLMLLVQRVSYVAYAYYDGVANPKDLNKEQEKLKISELPSLLEYFSYNFSFVTILAGPTTAYKEYEDFITGKNIENHRDKNSTADPSPMIPAFKKLCAALMFLLILLLNEDKMNNNRVLDPSLNFPRRFLNVTIYCFVLRGQYYFSHLLVESISNAGGLGFDGYDEYGRPKWDLVRCVDVVKFEFGKNIREQTLAWNIFTQTWLRRIVYERFEWNPVLVTCVVSAVWHGFYPGYYVSFVFVALVTVTARKLRLILWHHFQEPRPIKILYDIATITITNFGKDLVLLTFWLLTLENVLALWSYYNYLPIIVIGLLSVLLPNKRKAKSTLARK